MTGLSAWQSTSPDGLPYDYIGSTFSVQNAGDPWSFSDINDQTLRFEVRPGDHWKYDGTNVERSEVNDWQTIAQDTPINVSYGFAIEPGAKNTADWLVAGQFHQTTVDGSPPFAIEMSGENMRVVVRGLNPDGSTFYKEVYNDPNPIIRGHQYAMQIQVKFDASGNGYLNVFRDGQQIVSYKGPIGYGDAVYWKEGIYRSDASETIAADYSNLSITTGQTTGGSSSTQASASAAPVAPLAFTMTQTLQADTGSSKTDQITSNGHVTLNGTSAAGATVSIYDQKTLLGTTVAGQSGTWSWSTLLGQGTHTLNAVATNAKTGATATATATAVTIDTTAPTLTLSPNVLRNDTGTSNADGITNDGRLALSGTADAKSWVSILDGTTQIASLQADSTGHYAGTAVLTAGTHQISATTTDLAGNTTTQKLLQAIVVDTTPPSAPSLSKLAVDSGVSATDGITNVAPATFTGQAEANSTVQLYLSNGIIGTAVANKAGVFSFDASKLDLQDGAYRLTATATDVAGNTSATSAQMSFILDRAPPDLSTNNVFVDSSNKLSWQGDGTAGASLTVSENNKVLQQTKVGQGWDWALTMPLSNQVHNLVLSTADAAGNRSSQILVVGSSGADTLVAKGGNELLYGGGGNDTFVFQAGHTAGETVLDFHSGQDKLAFQGFDASHFTLTKTGSQLWTAADAQHTETFKIAGINTLAATDWKLIS